MNNEEELDSNEELQNSPSSARIENQENESFDEDADFIESDTRITNLRITSKSNSTLAKKINKLK